jgi:uncharacterized protein (TIGR02646 family)
MGMRYIDIQELEKKAEAGVWPPRKWEEKARKLTGELRNAPDGKARSAILNKPGNNIWGKLKEDLKRLSYNLCWYCEVDTDGMPGDIDHYRPKEGVTENKKHPGYWWLAYEWRNFRFSCKRCNSYMTDPATRKVGGKQNHFPLADESQRIGAECAYVVLSQEYPMLLDPTKQGDPQLLTFVSDGQAVPASSDEESIDYKRAAASIKIYHFNHSIPKRKRRKIYSEVRRFMKSYQRLLPALEDNNPVAIEGMKPVMLSLGKTVSPRTEYSSAARAYLELYRGIAPELVKAILDKRLRVPVV